MLVLGTACVEAQAREQVERLTALGQVWGFLKYYHPGVAAGTIHWDSVLVDVVPKVKAARTNAEFHATMQTLLDAAGTVRPCVDSAAVRAGSEGHCRTVFPDSMRINLDLGWLTSSKVLSADFTRQLVRVRDNRHQGSGRYVTFRSTAMFDADTAFRTPDYPGEAQRLLALFRFWNAARYYFPYMYVNGGDWNTVLPEFISRLIAAKDAAEYHLTVLELTTRLNDTHVTTASPVIASTLGARSPLFEPRTVEGQIVVWRLLPQARAGGLRVGDVITDIDGQSVAQRRRDLTKYIAAGSPVTLERKLVTTMLRARGDSVTYTIERDGKPLTLRVAMGPVPTSPPQRPTYPVAELAKVLANSTNGYINLGDINLNQVDSAFAIVKNTTGLVMDVRNYPRGTMYQFAMLFNPDSRPFAKFTRPDSTYPGQVAWNSPVRAGRATGNAEYYRGRIAILVDERTQSHAEFSVMALQTAPENKVIGSQTAGADGNITRFYLPGGVATLFTGLGVYYPNGKETQRVGIVPDIEVRPTLAGFRAGRDEVLERAIEYLATGR